MDTIKRQDTRVNNPAVQNQISIAIRTALGRANQSIKEGRDRGTSTWSTARMEKVKNILHEKGRIIPYDYMPSVPMLDKIERQWKAGTMEFIPMEHIGSKSSENYAEENQYVDIGNGLAKKEPGKKKRRDCYRHYYWDMIFMRKITIMLNAYLMVSYEHEGKWITLETATLYETKVRTMVTTHAHHGGWCGEYIVDKEFEIRQEWKKKMINEGLDLNSAVQKVVEMDYGPQKK